jgi:hypothetical protein
MTTNFSPKDIQRFARKRIKELRNLADQDSKSIPVGGGEVVSPAELIVALHKQTPVGMKYIRDHLKDKERMARATASSS